MMPPADMLTTFLDTLVRLLGAITIALLGCGLAGQWSGQAWLAGRQVRLAGLCVGLGLVFAPTVMRLAQ